MKRCLSILLCLACLISFSACGSPVEATSDNKVQTQVTIEETEKETESKTVATSIATEVESKSEEPDFSNAEKIFVSNIDLISDKYADEFVKEFGVRKCSMNEEIDLKSFDSFNKMETMSKSMIASNWNGSANATTDYVVVNTIGNGYFKLEFSSRLYILYLPID